MTYGQIPRLPTSIYSLHDSISGVAPRPMQVVFDRIGVVPDPFVSVVTTAERFEGWRYRNARISITRATSELRLPLPEVLVIVDSEPLGPPSGLLAASPEFIGGNAGLFDHRWGDLDGAVNPERQGDPVGRPAIENVLLDFAAVIEFRINLGEEGTVLEVVDPDPVERASEFSHHLDEEVVGEGPRRLRVIVCYADRLSLPHPDENGDVLLIDIQQDHRCRFPAFPDGDRNALNLGFSGHTTSPVRLPVTLSPLAWSDAHVEI